MGELALSVRAIANSVPTWTGGSSMAMQSETNIRAGVLVMAGTPLQSAAKAVRRYAKVLDDTHESLVDMADEAVELEREAMTAHEQAALCRASAIRLQRAADRANTEGGSDSGAAAAASRDRGLAASWARREADAREALRKLKSDAHELIRDQKAADKTAAAAVNGCDPPEYSARLGVQAAFAGAQVNGPTYVEPQKGDGGNDTWDQIKDFFGDNAEQVGGAIQGAAETALGEITVVLGAGGEVAGFALDASVIGASAGVSLNVASAGVIATGAGMTIDGQRRMYNNISQMKGPEGGKGPPEATGGVYVMRNPVTGKVMRTGRTNDLGRRKGEHKRDEELKDLDFEPEWRSDSYATQRGLAQKTHEHYEAPLDRMRDISPTNPRRKEYLDAAEEFAKKWSKKNDSR